MSVRKPTGCKGSVEAIRLRLRSIRVPSESELDASGGLVTVQHCPLATCIGSRDSAGSLRVFFTHPPSRRKRQPGSTGRGPAAFAKLDRNTRLPSRRLGSTRHPAAPPGDRCGPRLITGAGDSGRRRARWMTPTVTRRGPWGAWADPDRFRRTRPNDPGFPQRIACPSWAHAGEFRAGGPRSGAAASGSRDPGPAPGPPGVK